MPLSVFRASCLAGCISQVRSSSSILPVSVELLVHCETDESHVLFLCSAVNQALFFINQPLHPERHGKTPHGTEYCGNSSHCFFL